MTRTDPVINDPDAKSRGGLTSCYHSPLVDRTGKKGSTNSYEEADYSVYLLPREISCLLACSLPLPLGFLVCTKIVDMSELTGVANGRVTGAVTSSKAVLMSRHPKSRSKVGGTANCKS